MIKDSVRLKREKAVKKIFTDEPTCDFLLDDGTESRLWRMKAINWYAEQDIQQEKLIEYLVEYLQGSEKYKTYAKSISTLAKYKIPDTVCFYARMMNQGIVFPASTMEWVDGNIEDLIKLSQKTIRRGISNFRERVVNANNEKVNFILAELEAQIDQMVEAGYSNFDCYKFLQDGEATAKAVKTVIEELTPRYKEISSALTRDPIARAMYFSYADDELADLHSIFSSHMQGLNKFILHSKQLSKTKKTAKVLKPKKKVKRLVKKRVPKK